MAVEFFGAIDRQEKTGKIRSMYPSWYMENQIDDLKENIDYRKRMLKRGIVPLGELPNYESDLAKDEQRLQDILESKPKLSDVQKDELKAFRKRIEKEISNSMFTHTEMEKGYASPNEEADRMIMPKITPTNKDIEILKDMGINIVNGKVNRNQLSRAWQITGKLLEENTNVETLRKAGTTARKYIVK